MAAAKIVYVSSLCLAVAAAGAAFEARLFATAARLFQPCNYTGSPAWECADCHAVLVCLKLGGIRKACWWPGTPWCAEGQCVSAPRPACAPNSNPGNGTRAKTTPPPAPQEDGE